MADSIEHQITELGLQLSSVKAKIASCIEKEKKATDQIEKTRLQEERKSLENKETALLREIRRHQEQRRS
jgi:predicted  nucleic acid-binding Zn-ribbon protein